MLREHYMVQVGDNYLVHFPLRKMDILVDENLRQRIEAFHQCQPVDPELLEYLKQNHLVLEAPEKEPKKHEGFNPSGITIFPTSDCNLRCVYCYGNAGIVRKNLPGNTAKQAIDYVIQKKVKDERKTMHLGFHGGGEPFVVFDFVKTCVEYARREAEARGMKLNVTSATNGVLEQSQLEWIVSNFSNLAVSIDGPKDIQDRQRPDVNGEGTYERVMATIEYLQGEGFPFGTRSTITNYNVRRMLEMVEFFNEKGIKKIHFEPLFFCGRCKTSEWKSPDEKLFIKEYKKAHKRAQELKIPLYYSGSRPGNVSSSFCGAAGRNFCITPEGYITSCYEVSLSNDARSKTFFYGRINGDGLEIFEDRLEALQRKTVDNNNACSSCFLKWNCGGECLAKYSEGNPSLSRCDMNREISLFEILTRMPNVQKPQ